MFDLAWSEIALIGVIALIAIGPKDLPVAIKAIAEAMKKARRMAGEFQTHVDEMVREANLSEVRDQFNEVRNLDIRGKILGAVDGDGSIRRTMSETTTFNAPPPPVTPVVNEAAPDAGVDLRKPHAMESLPPPPAFIPPDAAEAAPLAAQAAAPAPDAAPAPAPAPAPAMIPPAYVDPRTPPPMQNATNAVPTAG